MRDLRTASQIEANKLDLDIYRAALMVERFAADHARTSERDSLQQMARDILGRRHLVRQYMHPKDREATS